MKLKQFSTFPIILSAILLSSCKDSKKSTDSTQNEKSNLVSLNLTMVSKGIVVENQTFNLKLFANCTGKESLKQTISSDKSRILLHNGVNCDIIVEQFSLADNNVFTPQSNPLTFTAIWDETNSFHKIDNISSANYNSNNIQITRRLSNSKKTESTENITLNILEIDKNTIINSSDFTNVVGEFVSNNLSIFSLPAPNISSDELPKISFMKVDNNQEFTLKVKDKNVIGSNCALAEKGGNSTALTWELVNSLYSADNIANCENFKVNIYGNWTENSKKDWYIIYANIGQNNFGNSYKVVEIKRYVQQ